MLKTIVQFSLRHRGVVLGLGLALLGDGLYTLTHARYGVFPDFAPPQAVIQTEAPGFSPEQVALLITQPIENAVNGIAGIDRLNSGSIQGLSVITITFQASSDVYRSRQEVAERLATLGSLPQGVRPPVLTPLTSSTSIALAIGLTSSKLSQMDLRTLADWTVKQQVLAVPGVSKIAVFGGQVKQYQVQIQPDRLIRYNLSVADVADSARKSSGIQGAGFIETPNQRIVLESQGGTSPTVEDLRKMPLVFQNDGMNLSLTLGNVAKVVETPAPPIGGALVNGTEGVILMISSQPGANTLEVTRRVEDSLKSLRASLSTQGVELTTVFRPADFIQMAVGNIRSSLLLGALLVMAVLFLFLLNLRTAAISCAAIPLSLLSAVMVLEHLGLSLNTLSLGGLAIAIGEVVDDAVIDVENIQRRLRENRRMKKPESLFQVVLKASLEVRSAVVYATFAVILVFLPILTLSGVAGRLFAPLGWAYLSAVFASLLVALTLTPALCFMFLGQEKSSPKEPPLVQWLKKRYRPLLLGVEKSPRIFFAAALLSTLLGLALIPFLGGEFIPQLNEGHFIVHMTAVPGTSLAESLRMGKKVSQVLLAIPGVQLVAQRVGRAELADDVYGTNNSEFEVDLKPMSGKEMNQIQSRIREALAQFVGMNFSINTFLAERIDETLSGYTAPFVVNIFGNDLNSIDGKAKEIAQVLNGIPGAADVQVQAPTGAPQVSIRLRKEALEQWDFDPAQVLDTVGLAYQGSVVGQVYEGNRVFDLLVILDPKDRQTPEQVKQLLLRSPSGVYVRLGNLADIAEESGRSIVLHEGARPVQVVTSNVAGRDLSSFLSEAQKRISAVALPPDIHVEFGGVGQGQARAYRDLAVNTALALAGIILLLSIVLKNYRNLLLVLLNIPFALVGGVMAAFFSGGSLSLGSFIGFITLFGITLRNSIMLISHYEHLVSVEGLPWGLEAAVRGASERLAPILMTALVTGLGLLPLAIRSGSPGQEIEGPMAIVILGGLVTSTLLNLLVLPALSLRYGRFSKAGEQNNVMD